MNVAILRPEGCADYLLLNNSVMASTLGHNFCERIVIIDLILFIFSKNYVKCSTEL